MTTIIHHKETLYADRSHVRAGTPIDSFVAAKIHVSADKQFAYGVSGRSIRESDRTTIEEVIRPGLGMLLTVDMIDQIDTVNVFSDEQRNLIQNFGSWVVMFKHRCFSITSRTTRELTSATMGIGTGFWMVCGMIEGGMSPEEAICALEDLDPCTGNGFDKITAESLEPFVIGGGQ